MLLKVLHINTSQEGGAAWCAIRLNKALAQQGVESKMLFAWGDTMPDGVDGDIAEMGYAWKLRKYKLFRKAVHALMRMPWYYNTEKLQKILDRANVDGLYIHQPLSYYENIAHHPLVKWADIVHLHWVPDFVDYSTFFRYVKKPIVWTLHDQWPAEGVLHYYSGFSPLPEQLRGIDTLCREIKRKGIQKAQKMHVVAISEKMKTICQKSYVLNDIPCVLIHNGVDCNTFRYMENDRHSILSKYIKNENAKDIIHPSKKVYMFSSCEIWDMRKGLQRVIDALEQLQDQNTVLLVIGANYVEKHPSASFPVVCTGLIRSQKELSELYSVSDYFILASYEESFAQTPLEAMACGTPVIATPCGVIPELVHQFNGVICQGFDSEALLKGIKCALMKKYNRKEIRKYILENYDYSIIAKEYMALYDSVLCPKQRFQ